MPTIEIDIGLHCERCGDSLNGKVVDGTDIKIDLCEDCLEKAREEGVEEGREEGYDEGLAAAKEGKDEAV